MSQYYNPPGMQPAEMQATDEEMLVVGSQAAKFWWVSSAIPGVVGIYKLIESFSDTDPLASLIHWAAAAFLLLFSGILFTLASYNESRKEQMNRIEKNQQRILENQEAQRHFHEQQLRALYGLPPE